MVELNFRPKTNSFEFICRQWEKPFSPTTHWHACGSIDHQLWFATASIWINYWTWLRRISFWQRKVGDKSAICMSTIILWLLPVFILIFTFNQVSNFDPFFGKYSKHRSYMKLSHSQVAKFSIPSFSIHSYTPLCTRIISCRVGDRIWPFCKHWNRWWHKFNWWGNVFFFFSYFYKLVENNWIWTSTKLLVNVNSFFSYSFFYLLTLTMITVFFFSPPGSIRSWPNRL